MTDDMMTELRALTVMVEARRLQGDHGAHLLRRVARWAGHAIAHQAEAFAARLDGQFRLR